MGVSLAAGNSMPILCEAPIHSRRISNTTNPKHSSEVQTKKVDEWGGVKYLPIPGGISCTGIQVWNVFGVEEKGAKVCRDNFIGGLAGF